jgi:hypothetical protein
VRLCPLILTHTHTHTHALGYCVVMTSHDNKLNPLTLLHHYTTTRDDKPHTISVTTLLTQSDKQVSVSHIVLYWLYKVKTPAFAITLVAAGQLLTSGAWELPLHISASVTSKMRSVPRRDPSTTAPSSLLNLTPV